MFLNKIEIQGNLVAACNDYRDFCDDSEETLLSDIGRGTNATNDKHVFQKTNLNGNVSKQHDSDTLNRETRSFKPYRSEKELSLQITTILDELLFDSGYDRQIRPQIEGPPLEVMPCCILGHVS